MAAAERIVIPRCIGCGAMYEFEQCEGGCDEQHLELVAAGDLDLLEALEQLMQARTDAALPVVSDLVGLHPSGDDEYRRAYEEVAQSARRVLQDAPPPEAWPTAAAEASSSIEVWRCARCGAVDAPQECLGICIWRRFEWVQTSIFEQRRQQVADTEGVTRRIFGLLRRIAFSTPRTGGWERSWEALSLEARDLIRAAEQTRELHV